MRIAIILLSLLMLQGCSVAALKMLTTEVERQPLNIDADEVLEMEEIKWYIITEENWQEVFAELKKNNKDPVLFGVTDDGYETLAVNFANIRNYIIMNRNVIKLYKDYYKEEDDVSEKD